MNDLDPLAEDLQSLLDAERELDVPAAEMRERLSTRLAPLFLAPPGAAPGGGEPADAASSAATGAAGTTLKAGLASKLLVPALCTALGAAGGAATHAYLSRSHAAVPVSASVAPVATPPPAPSVSIVAPPSPVEALRPEAAPPAAGSGSARAASQQNPSLRAERLLLESATAALMRGDSASALAALQKHARQYPRGALAEEREVLWVKALRAQGNDRAAEQRANDFKRKFPSSLQQGAVDNPRSPK